MLINTNYYTAVGPGGGGGIQDLQPINYYKIMKRKQNAGKSPKSKFD